MKPVLTHASFSIWIGVHLPIVLDDGQAGRKAALIILAVLCAGAAARLLAAFIPVKHAK